MAAKRGSKYPSTPASRNMTDTHRAQGRAFKKQYAADIAAGRFDATKNTHRHKSILKAMHRDERKARGAGKYPGYDRRQALTLAANPQLVARYTPDEQKRDEKGRFA